MSFIHWPTHKDHPWTTNYKFSEVYGFLFPTEFFGTRVFSDTGNPIPRSDFGYLNSESLIKLNARTTLRQQSLGTPN